MLARAHLEVAAVAQGLAVQAFGQQRVSRRGVELDPGHLRIMLRQGAGAGGEQEGEDRNAEGSAHGGLHGAAGI
ncbi:hypothetical protein D9M69_707410 [compost metagenome]